MVNSASLVGAVLVHVDGEDRLPVIGQLEAESSDLSKNGRAVWLEVSGPKYTTSVSST